MINYLWDILSLHTAPYEEGLDNVVKQINWRFQVTDGQYYGEVYGNTDLALPTPESYVPFNDIKHAMIVYWITQNVDYDNLVEKVNQKLEENKNPILVEKTPPWEREGVVPGNVEYLVVIDDQPNDLVKIWGPLRWDSSRINKGLQIKGFQDLYVPENLNMVRKGLLPITQPLVLTERIKIYRVELRIEQVDELTYKRGILTWDISTGIAVGSFKMENRTIQESKESLKEWANKNSTTAQHTPSEIILNNEVVNVYLDSESYLMLTSRASQMNETETVNWKLVDKWITASKEDLLTITEFIRQKTQEIFDLEYLIHQQIEQADTLEELRQVYYSLKNT